MTVARTRKINRFCEEGAISLREAATLAGRCTRTIRRWHASGKIRLGKDPEKGTIFVCRKSLIDYLESMEL